MTATLRFLQNVWQRAAAQHRLVARVGDQEGCNLFFFDGAVTPLGAGTFVVAIPYRKATIANPNFVSLLRTVVAGAGANRFAFAAHAYVNAKGGMEPPDLKNRVHVMALLAYADERWFHAVAGAPEESGFAPEGSWEPVMADTMRSNHAAEFLHAMQEELDAPSKNSRVDPDSAMVDVEHLRITYDAIVERVGDAST